MVRLVRGPVWWEVTCLTCLAAEARCNAEHQQACLLSTLSQPRGDEVVITFLVGTLFVFTFDAVHLSLQLPNRSGEY